MAQITGITNKDDTIKDPMVLADIDMAIALKNVNTN